MILEQHYLACLSQASYLLVDEETRAALVVDPRRDVEVYLERARELSARIDHVVLTHFHADFIAGHLELRARTGARLWMGAAADAEFDFEKLRDGQSIEMGRVRLTALETPGHTPESLCLLVEERGSAAPKAVLTGDTLFVGDVGRPDLMASVGFSAEELAGDLHDSLHGKLLALPDDTVVWPGHGAGSACGRSLSGDSSSTIGRERRENPALRPMSKQAFVAELIASQAAPPAYFPRAAAQNKKLRPTMEESLARALRPHAHEELAAAAAGGAQVLDVRPKDDFARAHLPGSLWIGLDGRFASWAGTLLDLDRDVLLVASEGEEYQAAMRLARVGIDRVRGFLAERVEDLPGAAREATRRIDVRGLARLVELAPATVVLDVRSVGEWGAGHVPGSINIPLAELRRRASELPAEGPIHVHCKTGYRSLAAASLLAGRGRADLVDVELGFDAWREAGLPVVEPAPASAP